MVAGTLLVGDMAVDLFFGIIAVWQYCSI